MKFPWQYLLLMACMVGYVRAESQLMWFSDAAQESPLDDDAGVNGDELIPSSTNDPFSGALIQLIDVGANGVPDAPATNAAGITGDDRLVAASYVDAGGPAPGLFLQSSTFADYGLSASSRVAVRMFDRPSSNGVDFLPAPETYQPQAVANYPSAAYRLGYFYIDGPVQSVTSAPVGGEFFAYVFPASAYDGQSAWTFRQSGVPSFTNLTSIAASDGSFTDRVVITWDTISGADAFRLYRTPAAGGTTVPLTGWQEEAAFTDTTAEACTAYLYQPVYSNLFGASPPDSGDVGYVLGPATSQVTSIQAGDGASTAGVDINWSSHELATSYRIYRVQASGGGTNLLAQDLVATNYEDVTASIDIEYYYFVTVVTPCGEGPLGPYDSGYRASGGTSIMLWYNDKEQEAPWDNDVGVSPPDFPDELIPGTPDSWSNGALVQMIRDGGNMAADPAQVGGSGVSGDDELLMVSYVGKQGLGDGQLFQSATFSSMNLSPTDTVYLRVFDRPSSGFFTNHPAVEVYTGQAVSNYPAAQGEAGYFYLDGHLQQANAAPAGGGFFNYEFTSSQYDGMTSWIFRGTGMPVLTNMHAITASDGSYSGQVEITWPAAGGADAYLVYRSDSPTGSTNPLSGWITQTSYVDTAVSNCRLYAYWAVYSNQYGISSFSPMESGYSAGALNPGPGGIQASDGTHTNYVEVTWLAEPGADAYLLYRVDDGGMVTNAISGWTTSTSYFDTGILGSRTSSYFVVYSNLCGVSASSGSDTGYRLKLEGLLEIISDHGSAYPPPGTYTNDLGIVFQASSTVSEVQGSVAYQLAGWQMTGHDPASGISNFVTLTVSNDAVLRWTWSTNYYVSFTVEGSGAVSAADGWYPDHQSLVVTAVPGDAEFFLQWSGDVPPGMQTSSVISLSVTQALSISVLFGSSNSPDMDMDGLLNELEVYFGTDPLDPDSDHDGMPDGYEAGFGTYMVGWGQDSSDQASPPAQYTNVLQVSASWLHGIGLNTGGQVIAWGQGPSGSSIVPPGISNIQHVSAGRLHNLLSLFDGSITNWGNNKSDQLENPPGITNVIGISAGGSHNLAVCGNGMVKAWGQNSVGQTDVPVGLSNVVMVAAGNTHSLALRENGTVACWGEDSAGQSTPPAGLSNVVHISGGGEHSLALLSDGSVVGWGKDDSGQSTAPPEATGVVAVAAGWTHSLALRNDGTVVAWGQGVYGETNVPAGLSGVIQVSTKGFANIALCTWLHPGVDDGGEDLDGDGLTNSEEYQLGSNPRVNDSDGDGVDDYTEVILGTDPADAGSGFTFSGILLNDGGDFIRLEWGTYSNAVYNVKGFAGTENWELFSLLTNAMPGAVTNWFDIPLTGSAPQQIYIMEWEPAGP